MAYNNFTSVYYRFYSDTACTTVFGQVLFQVPSYLSGVFNYVENLAEQAQLMLFHVPGSNLKPTAPTGYIFGHWEYVSYTISGSILYINIKPVFIEDKSAESDYFLVTTKSNFVIEAGSSIASYAVKYEYVQSGGDATPLQLGEVGYLQYVVSTDNFLKYQPASDSRYSGITTNKTISNYCQAGSLYTWYSSTSDESPAVKYKMQVVTSGSATAPATDPTRAHATFLAWDGPSGTSPNYSYYATYEAEEHTVTFYDEDETTVLKTETVEYGNDATPPDDPTKTGKRFTGWNGTYTNVTQDEDVIAEYVNRWTVTFYDQDETTVLKSQTVDEGSSATPPTVTPAKGKVLSSWDGTYTNVTQDEDVVAVYATATYTVTFKDASGTVLKTQTVSYGGSATAPADPTETGKTFVGWKGNYSYVTSNMTIVAMMRSTSDSAKAIVVYSGNSEAGRVSRVLSCDITRKLDGECTIELQTAMEYCSFIQPNHTLEVDGYVFNITEISKTIQNDIAVTTVKGEHISYVLNNDEYKYVPPEVDEEEVVETEDTTRTVSNDVAKTVATNTEEVAAKTTKINNLAATIQTFANNPQSGTYTAFQLSSMLNSLSTLQLQIVQARYTTISVQRSAQTELNRINAAVLKARVDELNGGSETPEASESETALEDVSDYSNEVTSAVNSASDKAKELRKVLEAFDSASASSSDVETVKRLASELYTLTGTASTKAATYVSNAKDLTDAVTEETTTSAGGSTLDETLVVNYTGSVSGALSLVLQGTPFSAGSAVSGNVTLMINQECTRREALMQLVALAGGELDYSGYSISIVSHVGSSTRVNLVNTGKVSSISYTYSATEGLTNYDADLLEKGTFAIGDEVSLVLSKLALNASTRIVGMSWPVIGPGEVKLTMGMYKPTISDSLYKAKDQSSKEATDTTVADEVEEATEEVTEDVDDLEDELGETISDIEDSVDGIVDYLEDSSGSMLRVESVASLPASPEEDVLYLIQS